MELFADVVRSLQVHFKELGRFFGDGLVDVEEKSSVGAEKAFEGGKQVLGDIGSSVAIDCEDDHFLTGAFAFADGEGAQVSGAFVRTEGFKGRGFPPDAHLAKGFAKPRADKVAVFDV